MDLNEWKSLKPGQLIYNIKSKKQREILFVDKETLTVTMKTINKTKFDSVMYARNERYLFSLDQP